MSDTSKNVNIFVEFSVPERAPDRITGFWNDVTYNGNTYNVMPALELSPGAQTTAIESKEFIIDGLQAIPTLGIIYGMFYHFPFSEITVNVFYAEVDPDTNTAFNPVNIYKGKVYQAKPKIFSTYMSVECRDRKYYIDRVAGTSCTEQCAAPYFGDPTICQKTAVEKLFTVESIDGNSLTVVETVTDNDFTFNRGSISADGMVIGIRYWESGRTFQTALPAPSSWVGSQLTFRYGCDLSKASCKNIHNNEARFLGLGIGMMDYDPKYSTS